MEAQVESFTAPNGNTEALLRLALSGLSFEDGQLVRRDKNGDVIATLDIPNQDVIKCQTSMDWSAVCFAAICGTGVWLVELYEVSAPYNYFINIPLVLLGLMVFFGALRKTEIIVTSKLGKATFPISDQYEDANAFVLSVRAMRAR